MPAADVVVALPTLGERLDLLKLSLDSVAAQRADIELDLVVVIPPAATEARRLAESYGARLVDDPRAGLSGAINAGIEAAGDAEFFVYMSDDDLLKPRALASLRSMLVAAPTAVAAHGGCDYIDDVGRVVGRNRMGRLVHFFLPFGPNFFVFVGAMFRTSAVNAVGRCDPDNKYSMDLDLLLKLRSEGRFVATRQLVTAFRWHADSMTVNNRVASSEEATRVKLEHMAPALRPVGRVVIPLFRGILHIVSDLFSRRARRPV